MKRVILVTGGNRGIGLAIVKGLARSADDIVLLGCRNIEEGQQIANEIGLNTKAVKIDLTNREELKKNIAKILFDYERVDVLVNNAGVLNEGSFEDISLEDIDDSLRVNTLGPLELIRAVLPAMRKNNYGRIINLSSGWGSFDDGLTGPFSYSFAKASLNALTLTVARSLPKHIKINSMCPGWVRTRMGGQMATRSPEEGAETAIWLANSDEDGPSGGFFRDKRLIEW